MKFTAFGMSDADQLTALSCDVLAVPVFQEGFNEEAPFTVLDRALGGLRSRLAQEERFQGKAQQSLQVHSHGKVGAQRVVLYGLGAAADFHAADLRHVAARAVKLGRTVGARSVAIATPQRSSASADASLRFIAEGLLLGRYRFDRYLTGEDAQRPDTVEEAIVASAASPETLAQAVARAQVVTAAIARARDLVNEPAAAATPTRLATEAQALAARYGLEARVLGPAECAKLGMGMYLAVSFGSDEEPRFIHLTYRPKTPATKRVCLVGKGVTFDSGGLSLKPSPSMEDMKTDMAGAAAVISAIAAVAELGAPVEVHAIAACTENMINGKAYKLGDVLRSMNGKTVEINNTDAEGRLTLGDAITYALQLEPDEIFDFATLTGACVVALGPNIAGVMSNTPALSERWLAAAKSAGEEMWPLPLPDRLREQLKSDVADMKNTGERWGGALTAGIFLKEFVGKTPWVHVDIAGPSAADKEFGAVAKGGTGFAVATIIDYLTN